MSTNDTTVHIPLSKSGPNAGKYFAIVDEADKDLADYNWYSINPPKTVMVYALRDIHKEKNRVCIYMHRLIMERILRRTLNKGEMIDHINMNSLDNRRENLRLAFGSQNQANRTRQKNNTSGYKGVHWNKRDKNWVAQIMVQRKSIYLGSFRTAEEAHKAYCDAADFYHKEYANYGDDEDEMD